MDDYHPSWRISIISIHFESWFWPPGKCQILTHLFSFVFVSTISWVKYRFVLPAVSARPHKRNNSIGLKFRPTKPPIFTFTPSSSHIIVIVIIVNYCLTVICNGFGLLGHSGGPLVVLAMVARLRKRNHRSFFASWILDLHYRLIIRMSWC